MAALDDMAGPSDVGGRRPEWVRFVGRSLVLLWAGFWIYFGVASGASERLSLQGVLLHALVPGGIFLVLAVAALRWERPAGWILAVASLAGFTAYLAFMGFPLPVRIMYGAMIALPGLLTGLLLLIGARRTVAGGDTTAGRTRTGVETFVLGLGWLALSLIMMLCMVGGATWWASPWGPGAITLGQWLSLVALNLAFLGLMAAMLLWQARICLRR